MLLYRVGENGCVDNLPHLRGGGFFGRKGIHHRRGKGLKEWAHAGYHFAKRGYHHVKELVQKYAPHAKRHAANFVKKHGPGVVDKAAQYAKDYISNYGKVKDPGNQLVPYEGGGMRKRGGGRKRKYKSHYMKTCG